MTKNLLPSIDMIMLSLMIISLPSFEAPKNIFLVGYLLTRIITEIIQLKKGIMTHAVQRAANKE